MVFVRRYLILAMNFKQSRMFLNDLERGISVS